MADRSAADASAGRDAALTMVTVIMAVVVGLTFLFGFGNVLQLGLRLGVPVWIAPLVAPAVDLSVVGLLFGTRHLALRGAPPELLRPARRLLIFSSLVTLALNIAEPLIVGDYPKAAFDSVGPFLLMGWSEVGPGLLLAMRRTATASQAVPPQVSTMEISLPPVRKRTAEEGSGSAVSNVPTQRGAEPTAGLSADALFEWARREDARYWQEHRRPISADELRKRLKVGSKRARSLVVQLRADAYRVLGEHAAEPDLAEPDLTSLRPEVTTIAAAS
jgi:hypothetical protein